MRWSRAFIPTLREDPGDAESVNHRLLVRGGFVRRLMAGSWSLLPLGKRVADKVERIIREEMDAIGGQEMLLPVVHPAGPWKKSGRWDDVEGIVVKFKENLNNAFWNGQMMVFGTGDGSAFSDLAAALDVTALKPSEKIPPRVQPMIGLLDFLTSLRAKPKAAIWPPDSSERR